MKWLWLGAVRVGGSSATPAPPRIAFEVTADAEIACLSGSVEDAAGAAEPGGRFAGEDDDRRPDQPLDYDDPRFRGGTSDEPICIDEGRTPGECGRPPAPTGVRVCAVAKRVDYAPADGDYAHAVWRLVYPDGTPVQAGVFFMVDSKQYVPESWGMPPIDTLYSARIEGDQLVLHWPREFADRTRVEFQLRGLCGGPSCRDALVTSPSTASDTPPRAGAKYVGDGDGLTIEIGHH